jgi:hypothetical protein
MANATVHEGEIQMEFTLKELLDEPAYLRSDRCDREKEVSLLPTGRRLGNIIAYSALARLLGRRPGLFEKTFGNDGITLTVDDQGENIFVRIRRQPK